MQAFSVWAPGKQRASSCHSSSSSPISTPTPAPSILGWPWLQECDGISANRQFVPRGAGAAPRRPHSPSHSKHKGLSSLSARLSSSGDSLPTGESLWSDKLLGPLLAALLGLQQSCSGIGIWGWPGLEPKHLIQGLGLRWGLAACAEDVGHSTERSKGPDWCQGARAHSLQSSQLLSKTVNPLVTLFARYLITIIFTDRAYGGSSSLQRMSAHKALYIGPGKGSVMVSLQ